MTTNPNNTDQSYVLTVRMDRPIQGCDLVPTVYLSIRTPGSERPRPADQGTYYFQYRWKRGPRRPACLNPQCLRTNNFDPNLWSRASLKGPELICTVCTSQGTPAHEAMFCSKACLIGYWKIHACCHTGEKKKIPSLKDYFLDDENISSSNSSTSFQQWKDIPHYDKIYNPTQEDIGCRLLVEVSAFSTEGNGDELLTEKTICMSEIVLAAPSPPPQIEFLSDPNPLNNGFNFRIVSYNVLSEIYATKAAYPHVDMWNLSWSYRRTLLFAELKEIDADIFCLQEVQGDYYDTDFYPFFKSLGYEGLYKMKYRENNDFLKVDGCAIFWKVSKFNLSQNFFIEFGELGRSEVNRLGLDDYNSRRYMNRLNRDNIAQFVVLEVRQSNDPSRSPKNYSNAICLVNTHLYSNQQRGDVKLWQTINLVKKIEEFLNSTHHLYHDLPVILCGDFNSTPDSAVHDFLLHRLLNTDESTYPEIDFKESPQILPNISQIQHNLDFCSVMDYVHGEEPLFTNYTHRFKGTLDYIFFFPNRLRINSVGQIPSEESLKELSGEGLPCPCYPSDHLMLVADMCLVPPSNAMYSNNMNDHMHSSSNYNSYNNHMFHLKNSPFLRGGRK